MAVMVKPHRWQNRNRWSHRWQNRNWWSIFDPWNICFAHKWAQPPPKWLSCSLVVIIVANFWVKIAHYENFYHISCRFLIATPSNQSRWLHHSSPVKPVKFADFTGDRNFTGEVHHAISALSRSKTHFRSWASANPSSAAWPAGTCPGCFPGRAARPISNPARVKERFNFLLQW